jgi:hypothetical protein
MGEHLLRRAGTLSVLSAFAILFSANGAFSANQLKFYITNKLDFTVIAKGSEGGKTEIPPGEEKKILGISGYKATYTGIVKAYDEYKQQCYVELGWSFHANNGCKKKSFSVVEETQRGCDLTFKECSGGNDCKCYFDLHTK